MNPAHYAFASVMVKLDTETVRPVEKDTLLKFMSAPLVPTVPCKTSDVPLLL